MGALELMAVGNAIPDVTLTMGSTSTLVVVMLGLLGVAACGIVRALPSAARVAVLRLVHAEGR